MLNDEQKHLYAQLMQWRPDDAGSAFPFSRRLARENGWTHPYARRVIEEYKRFVFLAMHAGHPVTPSGPVDQAWHLHLTYTQSYWEDLCENILHRRLHHNPTKGGRREGEKYGDLYRRTLQSYRDFFGEAPPADIWAAPEARFTAAPHQRWIDTRRYWIIGKPLRMLSLARGLVAALLVAGLLLGCASDGRNNKVLIVSLIGGAFLLGAVISVTRLARQARRQSGGGDSGSISSGGGDSGTGSTATGAAALGFAGMAGGEFGGGGSGGSYGGAGTDGGSSDGGGGDGGDGGGGCSGGCGGCGGCGS